MEDYQDDSDKYGIGSISSPNRIDIADLLKWFKARSILAGVSEINGYYVEFIIPITRSEDDVFVGVLTEDGPLEYSLSTGRLAEEMANEFGADMHVDEAGYQAADWTVSDDSDTKQAIRYLIGKASPETAIQASQALGVTIDYAAVETHTIWRIHGDADWLMLPVLPQDLPMVIFVDDKLLIKLKVTKAPIVLSKSKKLIMSYSEADRKELDSLYSGKAYDDIARLEADSFDAIGQLLSQGIVDEADAEEIVRLSAADSKDSFIETVPVILGIPEQALRHVISGSMPDGVKTATVTSRRAMISNIVDSYTNQHDPNAGPIKRFYSYINAHPILDWSYMVGETLAGLLLVYFFGIRTFNDSLPWFYYLFAGVGLILIIEGVVGIAFKFRKKS